LKIRPVRQRGQRCRSRDVIQECLGFVPIERFMPCLAVASLGKFPFVRRGAPSSFILSGRGFERGLSGREHTRGGFVILSAGRVICAECPDCEVALFLPQALGYIASAS